jgi:hypothetical protein
MLKMVEGMTGSWGLARAVGAVASDAAASSAGERRRR